MVTTEGTGTATPQLVTATRTPSLAAHPSNDDEVVKVGAGVGVGIGGPLLLGLGAFLFLWLRERRINNALKKELDACANPFYPILPSAWRGSQEERADKAGDYYQPARSKVRYARGQQELPGLINLHQLPVDGHDINQELPTRPMRSNPSILPTTPLSNQSIPPTYHTCQNGS